MNMPASAIIAVISALTSVNTVYPSPPAGSSWTPIPEATDEFNGTELDTAKWLDHHATWPGRAPSYFYRPNVSVGGGSLRIRSTPDPYHPDSIRAACVQSRSAALSYGYYEARIKVSNLSMTTSFWFQGKLSEMDVIEDIGAPTKAGEEHVEWEMKMNTHYFPDGWETDKATPGVYRMDVRPREDFHIYAMEWDASFIRYYLDGAKVFEIPNGGRFTETQALYFDSEAFVWQGYPTLESLQDDARNTFLVDWVRGWKRVATGIHTGNGKAAIKAPRPGRAPGSFRDLLGAAHRAFLPHGP